MATNNIKLGNLSIDKLYIGSLEIEKAYIGDVVIYESSSAPTPCFDVTDDINSYTATKYVDVYDKTAQKWYKKNNLNAYEEYGIYETGNTLSDFTYYNGKLVIIGETEYQYSNNQWNVVGTYIDSSVTYPINQETIGTYEGTVLPTTFKILMSEIMGVNVYIYTENGDMTISDYEYIYGEEIGTITDDGTYYYYSLPTTTAITIGWIDYMGAETVNIIASSKQASVEYAEREMPMFSEVYDTQEEMELSECPFVGKYGVVGDDTYRYSSNFVWEAFTDIKFRALYSDGKAYVVPNNADSTLTSGETNPSYLTASAMTSAEITDLVTSIERGGFSGCTSLSSVTIPNSVTSIGNAAFNGCSSLGSITIPNSVTSIADYMFYECTSLSSVTIGSGVTSIGVRAFSYCSSLSSITIPDSVTSIGTNAFDDCSSLTSITIGSGVTSIENWAFYRCTSLTSITCNAITAPTIQSRTFYNVATGGTLYYPSGSDYSSWLSTSNYYLGKYGWTGQTIGGDTYKARLTLNDNSTVDIPDDGNTELTQAELSAYSATVVSAEVSDIVTSMGSYAFRECPLLTSVTLSNTITVLNQGVFFSCTALTSVVVPDSVTVIHYDVFNNCRSMTTCEIGTGITNIMLNSFANCQSMTSLTVRATTPPTLGSNVLSYSNNCPIYVPSASVSAYKTAANWSAYSSRIKAIS